MFCDYDNKLKKTEQKRLKCNELYSSLFIEMNEVDIAVWKIYIGM